MSTDIADFRPIDYFHALANPAALSPNIAADLAELGYLTTTGDLTPDGVRYLAELRANSVYTTHGKLFIAVPGRTIVESRNGFTDRVRFFPSTYDRDQALTRLRAEAKRFQATTFHYAAR